MGLGSFQASIFRLALDFPSPRLCNRQPLAKVRRFGPRGYLCGLKCRNPALVNSNFKLTHLDR
ncbi:hypothetical protein Xkhy_19890 [Xanthomonas axonopodis pv. khayae]|nr:hypothetical protein Xkhy_19890 [Xanthomonas axonopodis pv. khayae]